MIESSLLHDTYSRSPGAIARHLTRDEWPMRVVSVKLRISPGGRFGARATARPTDSWDWDTSLLSTEVAPMPEPGGATAELSSLFAAPGGGWFLCLRKDPARVLSERASSVALSSMVKSLNTKDPLAPRGPPALASPMLCDARKFLLRAAAMFLRADALARMSFKSRLASSQTKNSVSRSTSVSSRSLSRPRPADGSAADAVVALASEAPRSVEEMSLRSSSSGWRARGEPAAATSSKSLRPVAGSSIEVVLVTESRSSSSRSLVSRLLRSLRPLRPDFFLLPPLVLPSF
mmetsp:Transcript_3035/g.9463  ORF Transcript_3035/g.9463 Transcript_3035/m.9463 type:complete len:290 (+) Transcript_3035:122-991(+)